MASAYMQSKAIKSQASWDASQMENNAKMMDFRSKEATKQGEKDAQQHAGQVKRLMGRQRAVAAAQGIEVSDGSAMELQQDTAGLGALDVVTIRNNAWKQAWGYGVEAGNLRSSANMTRVSAKYNARQTLITGGMQAASSIMSGYAAGRGSAGGAGVSSQSLARGLVYGGGR